MLFVKNWAIFIQIFHRLHAQLWNFSIGKARKQFWPFLMMRKPIGYHWAWWNGQYNECIQFRSERRGKIWSCLFLYNEETTPTITHLRILRYISSGMNPAYVCWLLGLDHRLVISIHQLDKCCLLWFWMRALSWCPFWKISVLSLAQGDWSAADWIKRL